MFVSVVNSDDKNEMDSKGSNIVGLYTGKVEVDESTSSRIAGICCTQTCSVKSR